ncbi:SRPBCC family protein [Micromonospora sp. NPDC050795]|uniref:SRPBCC family protein n=1 Tax=Micromonospora sp. NPDC050795 TaxID=3364282 RepID=UPI0037AF3C84
MRLNFYRFDVEWHIDRPADAVFSALTDLDAYPTWWPDYSEVRRVEDRTVEFILRAPMAYKLVVTNRFLVNSPVDGHFRLALGGDIVGWIDFVVTDKGSGHTEVRIAQECTATKALLRILAPIAKPAFRYNHALVMRHGLESLNRLLPEAI